MRTSKRSSRRYLKSDLARVDAHAVQEHEYRELPELNDELLARAKFEPGTVFFGTFFFLGGMDGDG